MADALKPPLVKPEVVAFIKEGSPKPQTPNPQISTVLPMPPALSKTVEAVKPTPEKPKAKKEPSQKPVTLVPINLRLPQELSRTLLKASSERKLEKLRPYTQQDIIAEALQGWFTTNGYDARNG